MTKVYARILAEEGEEAAKEYMRSLRSKDKPAGSLHYTDKKRRVEIARQAAKARWSNAKNSPKAKKNPRTENGPAT